MVTETPDPYRYDFEIPNNGDYVKTWMWLDQETDDSLLAATDTFTLDVKLERDIAGTPLFSALTTSDPAISGIVSSPAIATDGSVFVTLKRAQLETALAAGGPGRRKIYYDFQRATLDGIRSTFAYGEITLNMGVSNR